MKPERNRVLVLRQKEKALAACKITIFIILFSCTDLVEEYPGNLTSQQASNAGNINDQLYANVITNLRIAFQDPTSGVIALSELTTDELISPSRATDWEDNGLWRQLHLHGWTPDHRLVTNCFNVLGGVVFSSTDLLQFKPTIQQETAARFYRVLAMYWLLDLFDQVPYRDPGESTLLPARVRTGLEALDYIVNEVNSLMADLPDGPATEPNKNAARVLLMKCYLNKVVYANRQSSQFDFSIDDMNKVISLADEVINSGKYSFSENYFDNFASNNTDIGNENIFTQENVGGVFGSALYLYTFIPLHYLSTPAFIDAGGNFNAGGFNGWATLSDFYDKFEENDKRRGQSYYSPGGPPNPGNRINVGLLLGPQYNLYTDEELIDPVNLMPVAFTREVHNIENGPDFRITGIRPIKYAVDYEHFIVIYYTPLDNDWVYFRLPDVLLMKAEAILRGGAATSIGSYGGTALELVNSIRTHPSRGASALPNIDLSILLDERGRELWMECWRRQDLIRFNKFLEPFQEKNYTSDPKYTVFPIPSQQLAVNKNLKQNPGYGF